MATISSGNSLSSNYYLNSFYKNNRTVTKTSGRRDFSNVELSYEDTRALHRAAKALQKFKYDDVDNKSNITGSISAFAKTYNNTIESATKTNSATSKRYAKQLKKIASKYADELEDIGLKLNSNGSFEVNEEFLKNRSVDELKKVFGKDSKLTKELEKVSKRFNSETYSDIYSQMTGSGLKVDITL